MFHWLKKKSLKIPKG